MLEIQKFRFQCFIKFLIVLEFSKFTNFVLGRQSIFVHYNDIFYFGEGHSNLMIFYNGIRFNQIYNASKGSRVPQQYFDPIAQKSYSWGDFSFFMRRSKFCAVMDGHSSFSYRFIETLAHGCVPVVISDSFHPPFSRAIDWSRAPVIFLRNRHMPHLRNILESIPEDEYEVMQARTLHFAMMLDQERAQFWELLSYELMIARQNREHLWVRCESRWGLSFISSSLKKKILKKIFWYVPSKSYRISLFLAANCLNFEFFFARNSKISF